MPSWSDLCFGSTLIAVGTATLMLAGDLPPGSIAHMGPGYVPSLLGWLCIGLGAVMVGKARFVAGFETTPWAIRPLLAVSLAIALFMSVERTGLIVAVIGVTLIASLGDRAIRWRGALGLAVFLAAFASIVFVRLLGLPFPILPPSLAF